MPTSRARNTASGGQFKDTDANINIAYLASALGQTATWVAPKAAEGGTAAAEGEAPDGEGAELEGFIGEASGGLSQ